MSGNSKSWESLRTHTLYGLVFIVIVSAVAYGFFPLCIGKSKKPLLLSNLLEVSMICVSEDCWCREKNPGSPESVLHTTTWTLTQPWIASVLSCRLLGRMYRRICQGGKGRHTNRLLFLWELWYKQTAFICCFCLTTTAFFARAFNQNVVKWNSYSSSITADDLLSLHSSCLNWSNLLCFKFPTYIGRPKPRQDKGLSMLRLYCKHFRTGQWLREYERLVDDLK